MNGFFAVSGFLVTMSFDRRGWRDYVVARALRIVPALVAATLVTIGAAVRIKRTAEALGLGKGDDRAARWVPRKGAL